MTPPQIKLCGMFANCILYHFKRISIAGTYEVYSNMVRISIIINSKTIATNIPLKVILNISTSVEALQITRFEIIEELTEALKRVCNNKNGQMVAKKRRKKIK